jgi:hypothetical protein
MYSGDYASEIRFTRAPVPDARHNIRDLLALALVLLVAVLALTEALR